MKIFKIMVIAFVLFVISMVVFNYCDNVWANGVAIQAALYSSVGNYDAEVVHRAELLQNMMVVCKIAAFGCGVIGFFKVVFGK